jgi:hypothetical protein
VEVTVLYLAKETAFHHRNDVGSFDADRLMSLPVTVQYMCLTLQKSSLLSPNPDTKTYGEETLMRS